MSAVKAAASVAVLNKKALEFVVDTGPNEKNLADLGLSREFQREAKERMLEINTATGLPAKADEKGHPFRMVPVKGPILSYGLVATHDNDFRLAALCSQYSTVYIVMIGKVVFNFIYDKTATSGRHALELLFSESLNRGTRNFENNNKMIPDFWDKLLNLLLPEGGMLEFGIIDRDQAYVPSRLYFDPKTKDHTLSVGGFCYNFNFGEFPRESINKGLRKWGDEQKKKGDTNTGRVQIGQLLVKQGNKDKPKRPERVDVSTLGLKSLSEQLKVHERTPAEIAGDLRREAERAAKASAGKPAAKPEPKKGKAKASA